MPLVEIYTKKETYAWMTFFMIFIPTLELFPYRMKLMTEFASIYWKGSTIVWRYGFPSGARGMGLISRQRNNVGIIFFFQVQNDITPTIQEEEKYGTEK